MQKNISSGLMGGEGWFQTKISGTGAACWNTSTDERDHEDTAQQWKIQVDGNFALLRSESVTYSVQRGSGWYHW
jgi:uncharacterized protein (AIM24 family)